MRHTGGYQGCHRDGHASVFDAATGALRRTIVHETGVTALAFDRAVCCRRTIVHEPGVTALAFDRAVCCRRTIVHEPGVTALAFGKDMRPEARAAFAMVLGRRLGNVKPKTQTLTP
ncbi:hypothetical protein T484DRAFT_1887007 [Baffinella frigidus]|nr:hypothetical protein T484DRAFT_1887007 [Cryptophyta sp. CCMP2293]